jgi:signal transduction histidine kinase/DNA-binding response OmpR family regulator
MPEDQISILVVDDVPDKLLAMQAVLEELGQNVVAVQSGREALRRLLDQEFAVILLDVNMPDMNGFETAALIRQRKKSEHTPIIFVTAFNDETHAWQGYSLGAVDYILAPVIPEVLRAKVSVFVDLYSKTQQVKQQAEERVTLAREQAARAAAETSTRRSAFLAEASSVLAKSLDYEATLEGLRRLVLPKLAEVAGITLIDERTQVGHSELAWIDPNSQQPMHVSLAAAQLPPSLATGIHNALRSGEQQTVRNFELTGLERNSHLPVSKSAEVLPLVARNKVIGVLWLCADVVGRKEIDLSLASDVAGRAAIAIDNARLYREIQDGDRRKNEFLAMLGHELRNPLAAVANALQCLDAARDDEQMWQEVREVLQRQSKQMTRLVDDLLDVARITRGTVELRKEVVDLASAIQRAVATTAPAIAAREHEFTVSVPVGRQLLIADPTRLEQILGNLINNAAKYTEPGGKIKLVVEHEPQQFVIRVIDNGIGIPDSLLPQVFDLFTQGNLTLDRTQGGLGIGLTLVQRLVELHGGRIEAKSEGYQQGSEFVVYLPRYLEAPKIRVDDQASGLQSPIASVSSRRVLLVDDNADLAFTMSALLRFGGHEVRVASDGTTALEAANEWQPEVILLDIGLPGIDGYEVARRIRQQPAFQDVLLIAMTGYGQQEDRLRSQEAGFDHHLVKPARFDELQQILATFEPVAP